MTIEPMGVPARKKGKKKWLVAIMAALLASVEVLAPAASPLAELVVQAVSPLVLEAAPSEARQAVEKSAS